MPGSEPLGRQQIFRDLLIEEDEFSRCVSLVDDPVFWVRVRKPTKGEWRVTDLNPGAASVLETGLALRALLENAPRPPSMLICDVLPDWREDAVPALGMERRLTATREILAVALGIPGDDLKTELREVAGRLNLRVAVPAPHMLH
ncbi:hypothetical protein PSAL_014780 [Pseudooceanicola algae]|uniref:Uncharacterized protein n=1 Tax=Pseudooceanicola algae TaxID=1537215 RepID=A0A418SHX3_9RHOB|nr:hypothetical protein PSAL_014780 [Pseudooceanicola algae]